MAAKGQKNLNVEVYLEDVRCSHPHLFEPTTFQRKGKADPNSKPRYTCGFILDKKKHKKLIEEIEDAIDDVIADKWGKNPPKIQEQNLCLVDGDDTDKDELQGCMLLKAAAPAKSAPQVFLADMTRAEEKDGKPYGGCYVNALVRIYAYDEWNDQVNASLEIVQYFRKGEAFGKGAADLSKFKAHEDDDEGSHVPMRGRGRDRDEDDAPRSRRGRDEDDAPRGRNRDRDEDDAPRGRRERFDAEEEAPRSRRNRDAEEEAPRSRRNRDDDEDAPRSRRSRNRDDDDIPF